MESAALNNLRLAKEEAERQALSAWLDRRSAEQDSRTTGEQLEVLRSREIDTAARAGVLTYRYLLTCREKAKRQKQATTA